MRTLYRFHIADSLVVDGKTKIIGQYENVENLSEGLQKRLRENGLSQKFLDRMLEGEKKV